MKIIIVISVMFFAGCLLNNEEANSNRPLGTPNPPRELEHGIMVLEGKHVHYYYGVLDSAFFEDNMWKVPISDVEHDILKASVNKIPIALNEGLSYHRTTVWIEKQLGFENGMDFTVTISISQ